MQKYLYLCLVLILAGCQNPSPEPKEEISQTPTQYIPIYIQEPVYPVCSACSDSAKVLNVIDGDTIKIMYHCHEEFVRMIDIDCFESKENKRAQWQAKYYHLSLDEVVQKGVHATDILKNILPPSSVVNIDWKSRDRYGRILGTVYSNGVNINRYMLLSGGCVPYVDRYKK